MPSGVYSRTSPLERFLAKIEFTDTCWLWTGYRNPAGYGQFSIGGRRLVTPHRFSYEWFVGPIPERLVIDHLCRNPSCVNFAHLEPVTNRENCLRGIKGALTTHCPRGHSYDEVNTLYRPNGHRLCRECKRAGDLTYRTQHRIERRLYDRQRRKIDERRGH